MSYRPRKLYWLLGILVVLALAGFLGLPRLVDPEQYRDRIDSAVERALGRDVEFGRMRLSFVPVIGLRVDDVVIPDTLDGGEDLLRLGTLRIGARALPLLQRRLEITQLVVQKPEITLVRDSAGHWRLPTAPGRNPEAAEAGASEFDLIVEQIRVEEGRVTLRDLTDPARPLEVGLYDLTLAMDDFSVTRDFPLTLRARSSSEADTWVRIEGRAGPLTGADSGPAFDLALLPSRIPVREWNALLGLAGVVSPLTIRSGKPLELEGHLGGTLAAPSYDARVRLEDATLDIDGLSRPLEQVRGEVTYDGDSIALERLAGSLGSSDFAGSIRIESLAQPELRVDLKSNRLDFGELASYLVPESAAGPGAGPTAAASATPTVRGSIRIDSGRYESLDFEQVETTMLWAGDTLILEPLRMGLYGGDYDGRVEIDLGAAEPAFRLQGNARSIDVDDFLTDNLAAPGLLRGRFSGELGTRGNGTDFETILAGLRGGGSMSVVDGHVGGLDVLKTLSQVSGIFGESTLKSLAGKISREGTPFELLASGLTFEAGKMTLQGLALDSADFRLEGTTVVDLRTSEIEGTYRLIFSEAISKSMRDEDSKAAEVFWNTATRRVELPFSLKGPFDAPTPKVDLKRVARDRVRARAEERVFQLLGVQKEAEPSAEPAVAAADPEALGARIVATRWRGSLLSRDLEIEGLVHGPRLLRVDLTVRDKNGRELARVESIPQLVAYLGDAADPAAPAVVPWSVKLSGKRLLGGRSPFEIQVEVHDSDGGIAEARTVVER